MADNVDYLSAYRGMTAGANVNAASGVAPSAAITGLKSGPPNGVDPSLAMHDPSQVQGIDDAQQQQQYLTNPAIANFAAKSPAHVAATSPDWPALNKLSGLAQMWADMNRPLGAGETPDIFAPFVGAYQALKRDIGRYGEPQPAPRLLDLVPGMSPRDRIMGSVAGDVFGMVPQVAAAGGLANAIARPLSYIPVPGSTQSREQVQAQVANQLLIATMGLRPRLGDFPVRPKDLGTVVDLGPTPVEPAPEGTPRLQSPEALRAQDDANHFAAMEETIAGMQYHSNLPALTDEFLNETPLREASVWVDPKAIVQAWSEGHTPFPAMAGEIADALHQGREMEIPASTYLADVSGKPYAEALRNATRFREDGVSVDEGTAAETTAAPQAPTQPRAEFEIPTDIPPELHANVRTYAANADSAVEQVFNDLALGEVFGSPKDAGLTAKQFERYDAMIADAKAGATDRVLNRLYSQIRRERTPEWKAAIDQHTASAEQELAKLPALQAYSQLTRGKGVLGEPLENPFRLATDDDLSKFGKDLGLPANMFRKNGLTADQIAADLGFDSGAGMIRKLTALHEELGSRSFAEFLKENVRELATDRAREELSFDISPEGITQAVHEEAVLPQIEDFLGQTIKDLQAQVGDRSITLEDIKAQAGAQFNRLPVKQAANPKVFERGIKRTGEQALRALEKDDFGGALGHRIQQLLNFQQLKLSWQFRKEFERGQKQLKRWGRNETVPGTDPLIGAILQKAAMDLGFEGGRDPAELQRGLEEAKAGGRVSSMPEAVNAANDQGYALAEAPLVGANAATPSSFRDMMYMSTGVAKFGKELNEIQVGAKQWSLTATANEVQANAANIGRKYTPDQLLSMRDTLFGRLKGRVKSILINNLRPEVPLYFLDGEKQGPIMNSVINPLQAGKYQETDLINDWIKSMREGVSGEYLARTDKRLDVPNNMMVNTIHGPAHVLKTEGQYRTALMYLGSDTARAKLLEGFGWGDAEEKWLLDRASAEDKRFVQSFWDQNEKLFNLADAMYRRVRGYGLVKDEPRAVHFSDGTTLPGGHIHITYDPVLKVLQQINEIEGEDLLRAGHMPPQDSPLDTDHPIRALPSAFYGLERTGYVGPVNLDARALSQGVKEVIHDISFREPLQAAQKVLFDPRVREAIMSVLGPDYGLQISPWLHYIARERTTFNPATAAAAQMIRDLSSNFVFAKVAFNLSSTIKHSSIGVAHMVREAGDPAIFTKAAQDVFTNGYWPKFIDEMSGEVRGLAWNMDTNLQEALARDALTGGRLHDARQLGFFLFALSKRKEAQVTWLATFRREVGKHGNTEQAVQAGNKAVRDTQGASASVDLPTMFRKGDDFAHEIMRNTLGLLMGFRNTVPNRLWTANRLIGQAAQGKGGAGKAGSIYMTYVLGAALLLALYDVYVRGGGKAKKSKEENFLEELGWGVSEQTLGSIVGLNKVEEAVHYGSDSDFSRLVADGKKLMEGSPWGEQQWTDTAKMVGGATGIMPDSAVNLGATAYDTATGQVDNPATFIQRGVLGRQGNEGGTGTPARTHRATRAHRPARGGGHK